MVELGELQAARHQVVAARRAAAAAQAQLAAACVEYADIRVDADRHGTAVAGRSPGRVKPGEFVADEVSVLLREQPYPVRCLIARTRRLATSLPAVWQAYQVGALDAEQVRIIDRVARRVAEPHTLVAIDELVVEAAQTRCPKQLAIWLLRLVVQLEPLAFEQRHRKALAERRVTVVQGADGIGYVTGEVSAADAAAIDANLAALSRSLGAEDPRTDQQRRSDLFADLLLGRLQLDDGVGEENGDADGDPCDPVSTPRASAEAGTDSMAAFGEDQVFDAEAGYDAEAGCHTGAFEAEAPASASAFGFGTGAGSDLAAASVSATSSSPKVAATEVSVAGGWLEVEQIDSDTGELLGIRWQRLDADGEPVGELVDQPEQSAGVPFRRPSTLRSKGRQLRIGIVVPLTSLLNLEDTPGELADRSALIPAEFLRKLISDTLGPDPSGHDEVLFTRLLTDPSGRLLDTTELGRFASRRLAEAIMIRAGTCRFPTCNVPADRCDLDHHQPWPHGSTSADNLDPVCRRHHRGKTFAWQASLRDHNGIDWTLPDAHRYRCEDEPLPTGVTI
jgi:hypothetical protein